MIKKWWPAALGIIAIAVILIFALQQILVTTTLTEQEVINRVESLYNGKVEEITKNKSQYNVIFADGSNVYEVQVDEEQGTFQHLKLLLIRDDNTEVVMDDHVDTKADLNSNSNTASNGASSSPTDQGPDTTNSSETNNVTRITAAAAQSLALQQMTGEVEDVEYFQSADGGYYIVELENEELEAAFQIHAITGKILSVVYDD